MARKPRISFPGALHHIIVRGNHGEDIFLANADRIKFIKLIGIYHELYSFKCYAYALMPNHVHLLIEESHIPLPKIMQGINQSYTQYFNLKYRKIGHLFHGRYRSILCDKDKYLLVLVRYIHLNPVRANIVCNPEDYKWSSHMVYLLGENESFIETGFVLSLFSSRKKKAIERYRGFIYDAISKKIESELEIGTFLGDEEFVENHILQPAHPKPRNGTRITLNQIVTLVAHHFNVSEQLLRTKSREKKLFETRGSIGYLAREFTSADQNEIARYFNRSASTMSHAIQSTIRSIQDNSAFKNLIEQLIKKLSKS